MAYDIDQLKAALVKAHRSGDTRAAQLFADTIKQQQTTTAGPTIEPDIEPEPVAREIPRFTKSPRDWSKVSDLPGMTAGHRPIIQDRYGPLSAIGRGLESVLTLGQAPKIQAKAAALVPGADEAQQLAIAEESFRKAREEYPGAYAAGQIVGPMGGMQRLKGAGLLAEGVIAPTVESGLLSTTQAIEEGESPLLGALKGVGTGLALGPMGWLGGRAISGISGKFRKPPPVSEKVSEEIKQAGLDPSTVSPEWIDDFSKLTSKGVDPETAARVSSAESLPVPLHLTKGQAARNLVQQRREQALLHGVEGEKAQNILNAQMEGQRQAILGNIEETKRMIGGSQVGEKGEGAKRTIDALKERAAQEKKAIRAGYEKAKMSTAYVPMEAVRDFSTDAKSYLIDEGFDVGGSKLASRLKDIEKFTGIKEATAANVKSLETWRKRLTRDAESMKMSDPAQAEALRRLKGRYDDFMEESMEDAILSGDDMAIAQWKRARKLRADYGAAFEKNKIVNKLVTGEHTPEETVKLMFGAGKLGNKTSQELNNALTLIKKKVPSEVYDGLREEAFIRLLQNQSDIFSPTKFSTEFTNAMKNNRTTMHHIFNKEELDIMKRLSDVSKSTVYDPLATNPSKTSYALLNQLGDKLPGGMTLRAIIGKFMKPFKEAAAAETAKRVPYTAPTFRKPTGFPRATALAAPLAATQMPKYQRNQ